VEQARSFTRAFRNRDVKTPPRRLPGVGDSGGPPTTVAATPRRCQSRGPGKKRHLPARKATSGLPRPACASSYPPLSALAAASSLRRWQAAADRSGVPSPRSGAHGAGSAQCGSRRDAGGGAPRSTASVPAALTSPPPPPSPLVFLVVRRAVPVPSPARPLHTGSDLHVPMGLPRCAAAAAGDLCEAGLGIPSRVLPVVSFSPLGWHCGCANQPAHLQGVQRCVHGGRPPCCILLKGGVAACRPG
jgi:hypothetical protein